MEDFCRDSCGFGTRDGVGNNGDKIRFSILSEVLGGESCKASSVLVMCSETMFQSPFVLSNIRVVVVGKLSSS